MRRKRTYKYDKWQEGSSIYGFWQYDDTISVYTTVGSINKGDIVKVVSKTGDKVWVLHNGEEIWLHITYIEKGYFYRPGRGHDPATCLAKGMFGADCELCTTWKNKKRCLGKKQNVKKI